MNVYLVSKKTGEEYETYTSFVVSCENEENAKNTHPATENLVFKNDRWYLVLEDGIEQDRGMFYWTTPSNTNVELIGKSSPNIKKGIIHTSFLNT